MRNLHRELALISSAAWEQIEAEVARTFKRSVAGRRVVAAEQRQAVVSLVESIN
ncbi:putative linocin/CFP29 family protein [Paraburkholderia sp. Cpub6]|nr:putative linocin/CFP29 family protein [Paraburkholderia sp. Cpub6]